MTDNTISTSVTPELLSYSLFDLGIADDELTINQTVGDENGQDIYAFSVTETGEFNLSLEGLTADADLLLLDENIEQVAISQAYDNDSESITAELTPGEYYATVFSYDNVETDYSFGISNTPIAEEIPDPEPVEPNTSGDDVLSGNYFDDTLDGGAGNDFLYGEGGSDELLGGAGDDFLSGSSDTSSSLGGIFWFDPDPTPFLPIDPNENWWNDPWSGFWEFDSSLYLDSEEIDSVSTNVFSATATTDISTDSFTDYDWVNPYSTFYGDPGDEVDTLTGGEGADTFVLGDNLGGYYQDRYFYDSSSDDINGFYPAVIGFDTTNDYAIITDFNSQDGDVFQVYGSIEDYTLSTENFTGTESADTLIHYGSDLVAVVSDNIDISLEQDFTAQGSTPDFNHYFSDYLTA